MLESASFYVCKNGCAAAVALAAAELFLHSLVDQSSLAVVLTSGTSGAVVLSVVEVNEDYVIDSVAIKGLFVQHAMPSALKITLSAVPPSLGNIGSVVLKDVPTEGGGQDIRDITFADEADAPISSLLREGQAYSPAEIPARPAVIYAPTFIPPAAHVQELSTLAEGSSTQASHGGSRGSWVLRIKDLSLGAQ
eukprot:1158289-Pelagomonas_calceolata.AAC.3